MGLKATANVEYRADASAEAIWRVLTDGWSYAAWVVGAARVRAVHAAWPQVGTCIHHSAGLWPLLINDRTEVLACDPERQLVLKPRGWPTGEAEVNLELESLGPSACLLRIQEDVVAGPARLVPKVIRQAATVPRNRETLRRLALLAHGRQLG
jgi:hypothetical protein